MRPEPLSKPCNLKTGFWRRVRASPRRDKSATVTSLVEAMRACWFELAVAFQCPHNPVSCSKNSSFARPCNHMSYHLIKGRLGCLVSLAEVHKSMKGQVRRLCLSHTRPFSACTAYPRVPFRWKWMPQALTAWSATWKMTKRVFQAASHSSRASWLRHA